MNLLIVNDEQLTAETMKKDMDWASTASAKSIPPTIRRQPEHGVAEHPVDILLCDIEMPGEKRPGASPLGAGAGKKRSSAFFPTCHAKFAYAQRRSSWAVRIIF